MVWYGVGNNNDDDVHGIAKLLKTRTNFCDSNSAVVVWSGGCLAWLGSGGGGGHPFILISS